MPKNHLTLDGQISADRKYFYLASDVRFILDPAFYRQQGFGELGLMPHDSTYRRHFPGDTYIVTEELGVERFGNLTMMSKQGQLGIVQLEFVCGIIRRGNSYVLRQTQYKKDDLFVLYLKDDNDKFSRIGISDVNFEEEYIAKALGLGIVDELQRQGHGTAFLAAVEAECAKKNMLLLLHEPLKKDIPFYVGRGYRYLEHPKGPDFAKVLNPGFDERILVQQ
jgi:GNAT superfamily N-acetyltransferase